MDEDIKALCDEIYGGDSYELLNKLTCGDSRIWSDEERNFPLVAAAWLYCANYHEGQDSKLYEWLSRLVELPYHPSLSTSSFVTIGDLERQLYQHLAGRRPYEVEINTTAKIKLTVWAQSQREAAEIVDDQTFLVVECGIDGNEDHFEYDDKGEPEISVDEVEWNVDKLTDVGKFVEDEPEEYEYELDSVGGLVLTQCHTGRTQYLQGDEASELYDKLELMKFQSHINSTLSDYFTE